MSHAAVFYRESRYFPAAPMADRESRRGQVAAAGERIVGGTS